VEEVGRTVHREEHWRVSLDCLSLRVELNYFARYTYELCFFGGAKQKSGHMQTNLGWVAISLLDKLNMEAAGFLLGTHLRRPAQRSTTRSRFTQAVNGVGTG
jgi:hypothetical protein